MVTIFHDTKGNLIQKNCWLKKRLEPGAVEKEQFRLIKILSKYRPEDSFNYDESAVLTELKGYFSSHTTEMDWKINKGDEKMLNNGCVHQYDWRSSDADDCG